MTGPSGEYPPRREDDPESNEFLPPRPPGPHNVGQANLWADFDDGTPAAGGAEASRAWARESVGREPAAPNLLQDDVRTGSPSLDDVDELEEDGELSRTEPSRGAGVRARRVAWELVQTLVLAALIFLMVRGVAQNFRVEGPSMEPGLHNGQYLLVNKAVYFKLDLDELSKYIPFIDGGEDSSRYLFHGPERGDVVVFRYPRDPSRDFIKRIIGVPGDTVAIENGVVSVNGVALEESYINGGATSDLAPKIVPEGSYFVLGDNRPNSSDSRNWGFVPEENIIGKAMFSYWPLSELGGVGNTSIDLGLIKIPLF